VLACRDLKLEGVGPGGGMMAMVQSLGAGVLGGQGSDTRYDPTAR
jgi:hypothetical protein